MNVAVKKARNGKGVFACKDFKKGEIILKINGEILDYDDIIDDSDDYSTNMNEDHWQMKCNCGNVNCRKLIRDFKYSPLKTKCHI